MPMRDDEEETVERDPVAIEEELKCNTISGVTDGTDRVAPDPAPETFGGVDPTTGAELPPPAIEALPEAPGEGEAPPEGNPDETPSFYESANPPDNPKLGTRWLDTTLDQEFVWAENEDGVAYWDQANG